MTAEPGTTVLFVHVPKTAGSTCNWLIQRHFRPGEQVLLKRYFHRLDLPIHEALQAVADHGPPRVISSHMSFGLHEHLPVPCTYAAFVRDPVKRVLSAYRYTRRMPRQPLYETAHAKDLPDLLDSGLFLDGDNGQVRRISGAGDSLPLGGCTDETLQLAKVNLDEHFAMVGLTERFDESILLMSDVLGWPTPFYWTQNRNQGRVEMTPTDDRVISSIKRHNELDLELYAYAARRLNERVAGQGAGFPRRLQRFAALNRIYFPVRIFPERMRAKVRVEAARRRR